MRTTSDATRRGLLMLVCAGVAVCPGDGADPAYPGGGPQLWGG